jgi:hypothetical protein
MKVFSPISAGQAHPAAVTVVSMARALSGRGLLVGTAVLVLCAGGIAVAAAVGATPQPSGQNLGPGVVVGPGTTAGAIPGPTTPVATDEHETRHGTEPGSGTPNTDGPQIVAPAPVLEQHDDEAAESAGTSTHG